MIRSYIRGTGSYLPPSVVSNEDLARLLPTTDEWIRTRTGIEERRFADEGTFCSDLAYEASKAALSDSGVEPSNLDMIIFATLSPDHHFPGSGCYLQAKLSKLGVGTIGCLDVRNQCTGFLYSLSIADAYIRAGIYTNILVVGSEIHSSALDFSEKGRDLAVLFGDGAGAVVLSRYEGDARGIISTELHADGHYAKALYMDIWDISRKPYLSGESISQGDIWPQMDGKSVFKHAINGLIDLCRTTLSRAEYEIDDLKYVIPHQANLRINQAVAERLGLPDSKVLNNIQKYANTTAASIPILLDEAHKLGMLDEGDLLLLLSFGSGFTWASTLLRW
ncbi:MAG TPA: beta-ketoacyl-ACP synthase III [Syntrophobacteraceae bacterium]|nr:beta-ketoacyl-ACP synthase III [Syntrophobacteraceae bacterium]